MGIFSSFCLFVAEGFYWSFCIYGLRYPVRDWCGCILIYGAFLEDAHFCNMHDMLSSVLYGVAMNGCHSRDRADLVAGEGSNKSDACG